ncbi:MAG: hypothetical protein Q9170_005335 [Blastenia crenularia]
MGLGVFTAVASLVKTSQFSRLRATQDATYAKAPLVIWGIVEMWVVLIASSVAPLWPLLRPSVSQLKPSKGHSNLLVNKFAPFPRSGTKQSRNISDSTFGPNCTASHDQGLSQHARFQRLGSQTNVGDIEMTTDFTVETEAAEPNDQKMEDGIAFAGTYTDATGPKGRI